MSTHTQMSSPIVKSVYRYKFSTELTGALTNFATLHQFDEKTVYKESWERWCGDNQELINGENERLSRIGYNYDIIKKMYRSARYYYGKKRSNDENENENETENENNETTTTQDSTEQRTTRTYSNIRKEFSESIKQHIQANINTNTHVSPADSYTGFKAIYLNEIANECSYLQQTYNLSMEIAINKIKKTYKNKYFQLYNK
tara:strand:- start:23 stop:628 length:606 start_codon:yes stop_codon:yes gene_type:complete